MPDATYVGAGMPCAQCGNPLTPGQPHKCGRVGNPYAPSADWKPGQDTFTAQAAGIWDEGFAAGRAAATPDPDEQVEAQIAAYHWGQVHGAAAAASPDERLREENERLRTMLGKVPQEQLARIMAAADRDGSPDA